MSCLCVGDDQRKEHGMDAGIHQLRIAERRTFEHGLLRQGHFPRWAVEALARKMPERDEETRRELIVGRGCGPYDQLHRALRQQKVALLSEVDRSEIGDRGRRVQEAVQ